MTRHIRRGPIDVSRRSAGRPWIRSNIGSPVPRVIREKVEDLTTDSPLKDEEENQGIDTPSDMDLNRSGGLHRDAFDELKATDASTGLKPEETISGDASDDDPDNIKPGTMAM